MDTRRYLAKPGKRFRLKDHDPADTGQFRDRSEADGLLGQGVEKLASLQDKLYAQDRWGMLLIFQAMDAAGKDSVIKHVLSGVNPQGCDVTAFKAPSAEELDHDFLWRTNRRLPERGRIGVFNRSYYEEVLVVRIHPTILGAQKLPPELISKKIWGERYTDINAMERYLSRNGLVIRKFFLNVSKKEQARRFLARLESPAKNWKFSLADLKERELWDEYMRAYEEMIDATSTEWAPWYVIPADNKWYTHLAVADVINDALEGLHLAYPEISGEQQKEIEMVKRKMRASGIDGVVAAPRKAPDKKKGRRG